MRYYYSVYDKVVGPVDKSVLEGLVSKGRLPPNVKCCKEGAGEWTTYTALFVRKAHASPPPMIQALGTGRQTDVRKALDGRLHATTNLPYCENCGVQVNPNVVDRTAPKSGMSLDTEHGSFMTIASSSQLIKLCPFCGDPVHSIAHINKRIQNYKKSTSTNSAKVAITIMILIAVSICVILIFKI